MNWLKKLFAKKPKEFVGRHSYYIRFVWINKEGEAIQAYQTVDTDHPITTVKDVNNLIQHLEKGRDSNQVAIDWWKELKYVKPEISGEASH